MRRCRGMVARGPVRGGRALPEWERLSPKVRRFAAGEPLENVVTEAGY